jgi:hypothetical protein
MSERENLGKIPESIRSLLVAKLAICYEKMAEKLEETSKDLEKGRVHANFLRWIMLSLEFAKGAMSREVVGRGPNFFGEEYVEKAFYKFKKRLEERGLLKKEVVETGGKGRPPRRYRLPTIEEFGEISISWSL